MPDNGIRVGKIARKDITLDPQGISSILTGPQVTSMVHSFAQRVAASAEGYIPSGSTYFTSPGELRGRVSVTYYTASGGRLIGTRSAALVVLEFVRGSAIEARYGPLRKAAASQGVPPRRKRGR